MGALAKSSRHSRDEWCLHAEASRFARRSLQATVGLHHQPTSGCRLAADSRRNRQPKASNAWLEAVRLAR